MVRVEDVRRRITPHTKAIMIVHLYGLAQLLLEAEPRQDGGNEHARVLSYLMQMAPSFSLRGGTREILRGIIARGLGLR